MKDVCLLACESSIISDDEELSFAQSLANELALAGFKNVSVYAPPPVPKDHCSRLLIDKSLTSFGSGVRYYPIEKSKIKEFDADFIKNKKADRKWNKIEGFIGIQTATTGTCFIVSFKNNTHTYRPQNAIARGIEAEIDAFFATVIKELYILFENLGSSLKLERSDFKSSYNQLQRTYNELIELDTQRDNFGKGLQYTNQKTWRNVQDTASAVVYSTGKMIKNLVSGSTASPPRKTSKPEAQQTPGEPKVEKSSPERTLKNFFQTSLFDQFAYQDNDPVFKHLLPNLKDVEYLNATYGAQKINATGSELHTFMANYQSKLQVYANELKELHSSVQTLKASLGEAVNKYLDENPNLIEAKKNVIQALKNYLEEKNPSEIPIKQQALLKAIQENQGWSAGLFSKRSRTAVASAIDLIKVEEEYQPFRPK